LLIGLPENATLVVENLLDDECPKSVIKGLILSIHSLIRDEPSVKECEKRYASFVSSLHLITITF